MAKVERAEFRNTTTGYVGAVRLDNRGEARGVAVAPGESVWLGQEEQELTANAPRRPESNPSLPQPFEQRGPNTGEVLEEGERAPLELVTEARPTPTSMRQVPGVPPRGSYAPGEETGTPVGAGADADG